MKMKMNKACDLSSISVLPPRARYLTSERANACFIESDSLAFGKNHASQFRSQSSQQSFSHGISSSQYGISSSQHGIFSQLSQNSLDEIVTNDQQLGSQEKENPVKKISCLPPVSYSREESQLPILRSSTMGKWNNASLSDHRCQVNEEHEHRIGMMEATLNRFGKILDSVQSDVMQVNRGTKEVLMEVESIRQKLITHDTSLQLMNKGLEDIKSNLDAGLKSITIQLGQDTSKEKLQEVSSQLSSLPDKIYSCLQKLKSEISMTLTKEIRVSSVYIMSCQMSSFIHYAALQSKQLINKPKVQHREFKQGPLPKMEMGNWISVKQGHGIVTSRGSQRNQKGIPLTELEKDWRIVIDSEEEIDGGFSCLIEENGPEDLMAEAREETERILRRARQRKRKYCNTIILD
ncbi:putative recombination initiation defects 3 [Impatiens glandulifera]|uniref:putative recombination initiation defects 3 n=1 Tax=Impatiens glandulifera TaxID=253017 RepID=UPI001FB11854|nr:putative recombination initiation defects 3 [Impatiens glandulifera]